MANFARRKSFWVAVFGLFLLTMLLEAGPAAAGENVWTTNSLQGFAIRDVTIEQTNANVVYAATDRGLLVSYDGGQTWQGVNLPATEISSVAIDPEDASTLYIASRNVGVLKSTNRGLQWTALGEGVLSRPYGMITHPARSNVVYVQDNSGLFRSDDGGRTWSSAGVPVQAEIDAMAFDPTNEEVAYVAPSGGNGIFRTEDGGESWTQISGGIGDRVFAANLAVDGAGTLFAGTRDGLYRSRDGGQSWQPLTPEEGRLANLGQPSGLLAASPTEAGLLYVSLYRGLLRSENGGDEWTAHTESLPDTPLFLTPAPGKANELFAVINGSLYKTTSGGASWEAPSSEAPPGFVVAHPTESGRLFGWSQQRGGLWQSSDGAATWTPSNAGLEERSVATVAFDPSDANTIYAGTDAGLYRSEDAGRTWTATGLPNNVQVWTVAVNPEDANVILVGGPNGIFRSNNRGESWTAVGDSTDVLSLTLNPQEPETVYAIYSFGFWGTELRRSRDGGDAWETLTTPADDIHSMALKPNDPDTVYLAAQNGLFIRRGDTWVQSTPIAIQEHEVFDGSLIVRTHPERSDHVYLTIGPHIFLSPDGGSRWLAQGAGLPNLNARSFAVGAGEPLALYATFQQRGGAPWSYTLPEVPVLPTLTPTLVPTHTPTATPQPVVENVATRFATGPTATGTPASMARTEDDSFQSDGATGAEPGSEGEEANGEAAATEEEGGGSTWLLVLVTLAALAGGAFLLWQWYQSGAKETPSTAAPATPSSAPPPAKIACPNCGAMLPASARFCANCGEKIEEPTTE